MEEPLRVWMTTGLAIRCIWLSAWGVTFGIGTPRKIGT